MKLTFMIPKAAMQEAMERNTECGSFLFQVESREKDGLDCTLYIAAIGKNNTVDLQQEILRIRPFYQDVC